MAKFAQEILQAIKIATSELDSQLGPGTADLAIRIGLNSGPTTGKFSFITLHKLRNILFLSYIRFILSINSRCVAWSQR
jgi:hypothetical protein